MYPLKQKALTTVAMVRLAALALQWARLAAIVRVAQ
jgi:hypothetical protein